MLLTAEKINKSYGEKILLNDVNLYLNEGDKIGIIGINGTGKSTLLKILAGVEEPDDGKIIKRAVDRISYLPQNPEFRENTTVLEQVFLGVSNHDRELMEYEAKTILTKLGIVEFDKDVNLLSGGQKKRVAIASALIHPCEILILDEPTNHLDNEMVGWLEKYLKEYKGAIVMITHDRYFLDRVTNKIVEIDKGNLYSYDGNYTKFLELKALREDSMVASERKRQSILRKELAWIQRGARARGTKSKGRIERFEQLSAMDGVTADEKLNLSSVSTRLGKKTIEINSVSKSFGERKIIDNFDYIITRDARIGIVGRNGAGKSTLLNMIAGKIKPDSGNIDIGETVKMGYFSQEAKEMDTSMKVIDYIRNIAEIVETVDGPLTAAMMLEKFLFPGDLQHSTIGRLSGGERRRLYLLSILMEAPNILLLDEPTNDLDIQTLTILEDYLENFSGAVVVVSHDRYFLDKVVDRIFEIVDNGQVKSYNGGYTDYYETTMLELKNKKDNKITDSTKDLKDNKYQGSQRPKKLKFSFKEQQEYNTIDEDIASLEEKISELEKLIEKNATDYVKLQELIEEKEKNEKLLEEKMDRWVYLSDLAERIENSK